jgi:cation transport ATPase
MAQTKRKRKHRGNAAGIVERPAHNARRTSEPASKRPLTKEQQRAQARQRRVERMNRAPTWKGAVQRASVAALMFAVLIVVIFHEKVANAVAVAAFMLVVYIPLSYLTDRALYNWRQKKQNAGRG